VEKENVGYRELRRNIEEKHLKREISFETYILLFYKIPHVSNK
jgi:hypothetical protein